MSSGGSSNLIQLQSGSKAYGSKVLFDGASFSINEGEHVGVIGPNGAGKSTLFRVLIDEEGLDSGEVIRSRSLRLGYLAQEVEWGPEETVESYLSSCATPLWELKALGNGLGLDEAKFAAPIRSLSGGYRMRAKLLYLLGSEPNLMLLDEPTNYLDLETLLVLERFLQDYKGAFLLISHDREFLRRTTDHILEIESGEITKFPGNIDDYFEEKALLREQLERRALSSEAKRKEVLEFAARFGAKANKARQVQSRLRALEKMETIEVKPVPVVARIRIPEPVRTGKRTLGVRDGEFGYGDKLVLSRVNLDLMRGTHLAVVGFNGAGKSTLLKGLAGALKPKSGAVEYGHEVEIGYYAQHVSEELNPSLTVIQELERAAHPQVTRQEVIDMAGSLLFSGDDSAKRIGVLSGGEKSRVALGKLLLRKVPVLLLDEPTNHLDFNTVEALTQALREYQGTLVVVSHDRGFVRRTADSILEVRDGSVYQYPGTYDEYVWSLEKGGLSGIPSADSEAAASPRAGAGSAADGDSSNSKFNYKEEKKAIEREIRSCERRSAEIEKEIGKLQAKVEELNEALAAAPVGGEEGTRLSQEIGDVQIRLMALEEEWMQILESREKAQGRLDALVSG